MPNEADTCRKQVTPKLVASGWDAEPHSFTEQRTFTDGRIITLGGSTVRGKQKRADYILRYRRDFPIAVVEAKASYKNASDGLGQAKEYAEILGLKFAYATNGSEIVEFDFTTGMERGLSTYPAPVELWDRLARAEGIAEGVKDSLLEPYEQLPGREPRYYQQIAINRVVQAILQGQRRVLVTMATGTGKTVVAFQICWKLWRSYWNLTGEHRRPKILYLADRNILIDDPKDKTFTPFGDARHKITSGEIVKSREMYFAIYQAIAEDERRPGLYREYPPDFFDLIIVDECHRGSARSDSSWRDILTYFKPAVQLGMTATPLREDNRDTYEYFGNPIYTYSLRQGIQDGFLAPYRVHRVITTADAAGWRPTQGQIDRLGREIPDGVYGTKDFERMIALKSRTWAIARHLTDFLKKTDRFAKTLVFCVDQEHAEEMRAALNNLNADLVRKYPNYVCRVTADEGAVGKTHLSDFQDVETEQPVILTSSQLLTTGVDAPMVKNVAIARVVGSMSEFKQIIGRGTRVRPDYGKTFFSILDYTGSASLHFADPEFDGDPAQITQATVDDEGEVLDEEVLEAGEELDPEDQAVLEEAETAQVIDEPDPEPRKFYVDGGAIRIAHQIVYELDAEGKQLRTVEYTDYTAERVRSLFPTPEELRNHWALPDEREQVIQMLAERGISFAELADAMGHPEADPFDLLCHLAYNAPLRTRRQRTDALRRRNDLFNQYGPEAREILDAMLDKYAEHGPDQFKIPDVLKVPPISEKGNVSEIIACFGGANQLRTAVAGLQSALYRDQ